MMKIATTVALALALSACATGPKKDDVTTKGTKVDGQTMAQRIIAAKGYSGRSTETGNPFQVTMNPDGTYAGTASPNYKFSGKWRIHQDGRLCMLNDPPAKPVQEVCPEYYVLPDDQDKGNFYGVYRSGTVAKYRLAQ